MKILLLLIGGCLSTNALYGEALTDALRRKRAEIKVAIGDKKLQLIEREVSQKRLVRITQLLSSEGIGEKTVIIVEKIIGIRFDDNFSSK